MNSLMQPDVSNTMADSNVSGFCMIETALALAKLPYTRLASVALHPWVATRPACMQHIHKRA